MFLRSFVFKWKLSLNGLKGGFEPKTGASTRPKLAKNRDFWTFLNLSVNNKKGVCSWPSTILV